MGEKEKMSSADMDKMNSQDRERWRDCGPRVNEAKRLKRSLEPIRLFESSSQETCFKQIIHRVKMSAAKMLHVTNMDLTNKTNTTHKSLVCLVCDCFILGTFKKVPSMSMSDIKRHSHRLSVKRYEEFYGEALRTRSLSLNTMYPVFQECFYLSELVKLDVVFTQSAHIARQV